MTSEVPKELVSAIAIWLMVTFGYLLINGVNYLLPIYGLAVVLVTYFGRVILVEVISAVVFEFSLIGDLYFAWS